MCLYPKLIKNRKYIANKKNGGVIPAVLDERVKLVSVGCGKCMECKKRKHETGKCDYTKKLRQIETANS